MDIERGGDSGPGKGLGAAPPALMFIMIFCWKPTYRPRIPAKQCMCVWMCVYVYVWCLLFACIYASMHLLARPPKTSLLLEFCWHFLSHLPNPVCVNPHPRGPHFLEAWILWCLGVSLCVCPPPPASNLSTPPKGGLHPGRGWSGGGGCANA